MKRKPGRPKGTDKLPLEYWRDLAELLVLWKPGKPKNWVVNCGGELKEFWIELPAEKPVGKISKMCKDISIAGGVKWIDRTGKIVHEITDKKILATRFHEAWQKAQQEREARMSPKHTITSTSTDVSSDRPFSTEMSPTVPWSTETTEMLTVSRVRRRTKLQIGKK